MQIEVRSRDNASHTELRGWAVDLVAGALHRFNNHVRKVVIRIQDVNGPKGGIDKDVTISLQVRSGGSKLIRQQAESYEAAIATALGRAKQVLQRSRAVGARRPSRSPRGRGLAAL